MLYLLNADSDVDAVDDVGVTAIFHASKLLLLEPFKINGETACVPNRFSNRYNSISLGKETRSPLEHTIEVVAFKQHQFHRDDASIDDAEPMVDATIRLVAERR